LFVALPAWFWYNGRETGKRIWAFWSVVIAASVAQLCRKGVAKVTFSACFMLNPLRRNAVKYLLVCKIWTCAKLWENGGIVQVQMLSLKTWIIQWHCLFMLFMVSVLLAIALCGCSESDQDKKIDSDTKIFESQSLNAKVVRSPDSLSVTNQDNFSYDKPEIKLNGSGFLNEGYTLHPDSIPPGGEKIYELTEFSKDDGTRYNPETMKLKAVEISCDTAKGEKAGYMSGTFRD
jgi:hypothetical protein